MLMEVVSSVVDNEVPVLMSLSSESTTSPRLRQRLWGETAESCVRSRDSFRSKIGTED